jgi:hypothetical protein
LICAPEWLKQLLCQNARLAWSVLCCDPHPRKPVERVPEKPGSMFR